MKNQEPNKETGNLEELFRHHLAEAAVPPAPRVWEQVDNALLLSQNQTYRRRLRVARWVAAASLLLASLAGTGWWVQRESHPAEVAITATATGLDSPAWRRQPAPATRPTPLSGPNPAAATGPARARTTAAGSPASLAASLPPPAAATSAAGRATADAANPAAGPLRAGRAATPKLEAASPATGRRDLKGTLLGAGGGRAGGVAVSVDVSQKADADRSQKAEADQRFATAKGWLPPGAAAGQAYMAGALAAASRSGRAADAPAPSGPDAGPRPAGTYAGRSGGQPLAALPLLEGLAVNLSRGSAAALPAPLATQPLAAAAATAELPAAQARRWRLGLRYAAGVFQANLNFAPAGSAAYYSPGPVVSSFALAETAAAEYHAQQRPGLSQRLRLQVSRHLRGHWSLATGLEVAQQESHSATSYFFTGEQLAYYNRGGLVNPQRATSSRYRTAGLPLELRYANSAKTGFSLYGRAGVVVSALLTSRTEVEGSPEATRTYNLLSASTPYRRVLGTARGAVGVQFRPVSHDYTLSLGPVAEGGLWSLNAHPAQGFFSESRPYSFGLEAGVEFGRSDKKAQ